MTNLPITSNNAQLSANAASTARKDDVTNAQPADPFGAVLARQMDEANAPAPNTPSSAAGLDTKATTDSAESSGKTEPDPVPAAESAPLDPSNALAVMLQLPQEIKTSVAKDATGSTTAPALDPSLGKVEANQLVNDIGASPVSAKIDLAAIASGKADAAAKATQPANNIGASPVSAKSDLAAIASGKADAAARTTRPANNIGASPVSAKSDLAAIASGKADAAIMAADRSALHSGFGLEITKSAELSNSLLSAGQSAQGIAQSVASMAASGIASGMPAYNRTSDSMQTISSPLGSSGWPEEFSQKISWISAQQNQVAELHLNPPDLGPLDVVLKISDNQATALFTSPHSAVRDAVENALPRLREMLADNGITLGNTTVSDQPSRDRSADGFSGNGFGTAARREFFDEASRLAGLSPVAAQPAPMRRHNGMVDTFA